MTGQYGSISMPPNAYEAALEAFAHIHAMGIYSPFVIYAVLEGMKDCLYQSHALEWHHWAGIVFAVIELTEGFAISCHDGRRFTRSST